MCSRDETDGLRGEERSAGHSRQRLLRGEKTCVRDARNLGGLPEMIKYSYVVGQRVRKMVELTCFMVLQNAGSSR